jgi:hypothetical protein
VNKLEDRLRDAYRAAAETVRPGSVPELPGRRVSHARPAIAGTRRGIRLIVPLGAAAAVATVAVLAAVIVPLALPGQHRAGNPAHHRGQRPAAAAAWTGPRFYVANADVSGTRLAVYNAATGHVVTQVRPAPGLRFQGGAAAIAGDRTFVLALWPARPRSCGTWLYQLKLTARGTAAGLTRLRGGEISGFVFAVAATADLKAIAYTDELCHPDTLNTIGIIRPGRGTVRQWSLPKQLDVNSLALSADGHLLAYSSGGGNYPYAIGLLHTGAAAGTLARRGRSIVRAARLSPASTLQSAVIAGGFVYFCAAETPARSVLFRQGISNRTTAVAHRFSGGQYCALSLDSSGRFLLVAWSADQSTTSLARLDTATGRVTRLPAIAGRASPAW